MGSCTSSGLAAKPEKVEFLHTLVRYSSPLKLKGNYADIKAFIMDVMKSGSGVSLNHLTLKPIEESESVSMETRISFNFRKARGRN